MVLIDGLASEQPLFKNEKKIFEIGEAAKLRNFAPPPLAHENIDRAVLARLTLARRNKFRDGKRFSACPR